MECSTAGIKAQFIQTGAIPLESSKTTHISKASQGSLLMGKVGGQVSSWKNKRHSAWGTGFAVSHRVKPPTSIPASWKLMDTQVIKLLLEKLFFSDSVVQHKKSHV